MPSDKDKTLSSEEILKEEDHNKILTEEESQNDYEIEQSKEFFDKDEDIIEVDFD